MSTALWDGGKVYPEDALLFRMVASMIHSEVQMHIGTLLFVVGIAVRVVLEQAGCGLIELNIVIFRTPMLI